MGTCVARIEFPTASAGMTLETVQLLDPFLNHSLREQAF